MGAARAKAPDSSGRVTAGLHQLTGFRSGIDERTNDTGGAQVEEAADFIDVQGQRSSETYRRRVSRRLEHRLHSLRVASRMLGINHEPVVAGMTKDFRDRRVTQRQLRSQTRLSGAEPGLKLLRFVQFDEHGTDVYYTDDNVVNKTAGPLGKFKLKILFIPRKVDFEPWYSDFLEAVGGRCPVALFQHGQPVEPQFAGVDFVAEGGVLHTREMIDAAARQRVKLWQILATGMDSVDVDYFRINGITIANTPGLYSAIALAEHALHLMLCVTKNVAVSQRHVRSGIFERSFGDELFGKTLGLIGLGASGKELARRAGALGMRVMAIDPIAVSPEILAEMRIDSFAGTDGLERLLAESDIVSIHVPLSAATRRLINRRTLGLMKPGAILINVARGPIVDQEALVEALRQGSIAGAGLDVFEEEPIDPGHPLLQMDNVMATPHLAGVTRGTSRRRGQAAADNIFRVHDGSPPIHVVTSK
jgi:glyoxylate reductase